MTSLFGRHSSVYFFGDFSCGGSIPDELDISSIVCWSVLFVCLF
jgi:hypothetical protein